MVELKFLKNVEILSHYFTIIWDKEDDGGYFSLADSIIRIGIKSHKKDPLYTYQVLSHEIMEVVLVIMGARFSNSRNPDYYLFNFGHQTFENAIQAHSQAILKFIK